MGHNFYFARVNKEEVLKLHNMKKNEFYEWCKQNNIKIKEYEDYDYIDFFDILKQLNAVHVYCFGKWYENETAICDLGNPLFDSYEIESMFKGFDPFIVSKVAVESAIEWQREKILNHYELMSNEELYRKENPTDNRPMLEIYKEEFARKAKEWRASYITPYNLDNEDKEEIVNSYLYEYSIFDLVRIYKDTNWEKDMLIFYGC